MTTRYPTYYDGTNKVITPIPTGDTLDPTLIPVSARTGNLLINAGDGLYAGYNSAQQSVYVSFGSGIDAPGNGSKTTPYKTMDFAIAQQSFAGGVIGGSLTIFLKCGETHPLANRYFIDNGLVTLCWYGDPQYGDYPGATVSGTTFPSFMQDLVRPVITLTTSQTNGLWNLSGFNFGNRTTSSSRLLLAGVTTNIPVIPTGATGVDSYGMYSDFVTYANNSNGTLALEGAQVNKLDNSCFGMLGVHARATACSLTAFSPQLLVGGQLVQDTSATVTQLAARQWFIKFYPDYAGNNQTVLTPNTSTGSPGSSLLRLMWSETTAQSVVGPRQNQATFPKRFDPSYGIRNYFNGLVRDQQSRPLNVQAGFLF